MAKVIMRPYPKDHPIFSAGPQIFAPAPIPRKAAPAKPQQRPQPDKKK